MHLKINMQRDKDIQSPNTNKCHHLDGNSYPNKLNKMFKLWTCELCNVAFANQIAIITHYNGKRHLKNLKNLLISANEYCKICNVTIKHENDRLYHYSSKRHLKRAANLANNNQTKDKVQEEKDSEISSHFKNICSIDRLKLKRKIISLDCTEKLEELEEGECDSSFSENKRPKVDRIEESSSITNDKDASSSSILVCEATAQSILKKLNPFQYFI